MRMPKFTAEDSLYQTTRPYCIVGDFKGNQPSAMLYLQRPTGPTGPIGLPGQDCYGACLHVCMTFGGGPNCVADCFSECVDLPGLHGSKI
jgi:hypothetical protein